MKLKTTFAALLCLLLIKSVANAQSGQMQLSNIVVEIGGQADTAQELNVPFAYGKWSPNVVIYNENGNVIKASFKLVSHRSERSEMKNSSINLYVDYIIECPGDKRQKSVEHIYYMDNERKFESSETFSMKPNRYDIKIMKLKFNGKLIEGQN